MTIIDDYFEYLNNYTKKYGEKCIVLMEVVHFYEFYGVENNDMKKGCIYDVASILNIQVTRKNKSIPENNMSNPLMAGFPSLALKKYIHLLNLIIITIIFYRQENIFINYYAKFIRKIDDAKKYNLDYESLFIEFKSKVLNE